MDLLFWCRKGQRDHHKFPAAGAAASKENIAATEHIFDGYILRDTHLDLTNDLLLQCLAMGTQTSISFGTKLVARCIS